MTQDVKEKFLKDGYVVIESGMDDHVLDGIVSDLARFFGDDREIPIHVPHSDHGRIQDAWHISQNVLSIATAPNILKTLEEIYEKPPKPFQTLNFYKGTEQPVHSDSIHFNSEPFGAMCGVWTALEDIGENQGPLIYYPGSQHLPEMNYQDFGLEASYDSYPQYLEELQKLIKEHGYQPDYGILRKGQSLIWSANILHGGSTQNDKSLSRHSQVTHYYLGDVKAWRPVMSVDERSYFEPEEVRDVSGEPYKFPIKEEVLVPPLPRRIINAIRRRVSWLKSK